MKWFISFPSSPPSQPAIDGHFRHHCVCVRSLPPGRVEFRICDKFGADLLEARKRGLHTTNPLFAYEHQLFLRIRNGLWSPVFLAIAMSYIIVRVYMFVEIFVGLRLLPKGAYRVVDWEGYVPRL
jgi:hypothetical protein